MTQAVNANWKRMNLPQDVQDCLGKAKSIVLPESRQQIVDMSFGGSDKDFYEVGYDVPGQGYVKEAEVVLCRNGVAVNYPDPYMRRRDPESMVIADDKPTDKKHYNTRFKKDFPTARKEIIDWLSEQDLIILPFYSGGKELGYASLLIAPANASFFAAGLVDLQGMVKASELPEGFKPRAIFYLAPPFRHTLCEGKQVTIHNRGDEVHELFALNLYPGPSAKKGVYGVLLSMGEKEGWITAHGSVVKVITPYDNEMTILHEGASGGGKSEMLEYPHREHNGRLILGKNSVTGEKIYTSISQGCELRPVTDDMALCHPSFQKNSKKLVVCDAENGWFVRVNHITHYGVDGHLENLCIHPKEPLVFLNLHAVPRSTCLIWEHTMDKPGVPCPNPRVIMPRHIVPGVVNEPVAIDVRSFGVRMPPCTKEKPTYGIAGVLHFLPPSIAWLWRLVSPRGHANPSIVDTEGMSSEGVGSYWPFATGRRVDQANLLLDQVLKTPHTRYTFSPNQNVGAWSVGFMPQWIAREYMARRGSAKFKPEQLKEARCPLLGYALNFMQIEGHTIPQIFLQTDLQPEIGEAGYDAGAKILVDFFHRELKSYLNETDLNPLGREIIDCCLRNGTLAEYEKLIQF